MIEDNFDNDHIFEVQLITLFLEWLCNGNSQSTYSGIGSLILYQAGSVLMRHVALMFLAMSNPPH